MNNFYKRSRYRIYLGLGLVILSLTAPCGAVTEQEIEKIRGLSVLSGPQLDTLEAFIVDQFRSIQSASDASDVSGLIKKLLEISTTRVSEKETQRHYSDRFAQAVKENYGQVYNKGKTLSLDPDQEKKQLGRQLKLAAAVLLATGDNKVAIDDLVGLLADEQSEVRYWAAKGLAGPKVNEFLSGADEQDAVVRGVLQGLRNCLNKEGQTSVVSQIAAAADLNGHRDAWALIQLCATKRVEQYRSWNVESEWADLDIIRRLIDAAGTQTAQNDEELRRSLVRSAADLYCAAYERYMTGMLYQEADGTPVVLLSVSCQQALQTLFIEGEIVILRLTNKVTNAGRTGRFLPALKGRNWKKVESAYLALMGPGGVVNRAFDIYGGTAGPLTLTDPPQDVIDRAKTLKDVKSKAKI